MNVTTPNVDTIIQGDCREEMLTNTIEVCGALEQIADGKIGPDAETGNMDHVVGPDQMVPNGKVWQITEERKAAIDRGLQFLEWSYAKNSAHDTKKQIAVLRAMLEASQ